MMKRFEEKSVLITGPSRGIGKGIAQRFAAEGANLILAANEASIHELAEVDHVMRNHRCRLTRSRNLFRKTDLTGIRAETSLVV
jgi:NAD(P)-dependent dehydrogenase (short-subunit alcohol dehydrogenase family)